jgi:hypothetical protein
LVLLLLLLLLLLQLLLRLLIVENRISAVERTTSAMLKDGEIESGIRRWGIRLWMAQ